MVYSNRNIIVKHMTVRVFQAYEETEVTRNSHFTLKRIVYLIAEIYIDADTY